MRTAFFQSLRVKLTLTLLLTSLIGVALAGVLAYRTTVTEFDQLRIEQAQDRFVAQAAAYYAANGTWVGLAEWLRAEPLAPEVAGVRLPPDLFGVAAADGLVVMGSGPLRMGAPAPPDLIQRGTPIVVDGVRVGTVLVIARAPALDPREQRYLDNTNRALVLGALAAVLAALVVGLLVTRQLLNPLAALTAAITAMRRGDLAQEVEIMSQDELGLLAQTFNQMSADLARANQRRQQMTADIAHDLRTPLTVISGYLEALRDGALPATPERFALMGEEVDLLLRLVEDLRTLSLADAGELRLVRTMVTPAELLQRAAAAFATQAAHAGVELRVHVAAGTPAVLIDGERMAQMLGNLVSNALRYTPAGGQVTLAAESTLAGVQLTVGDTGAGIAPEDLPRVFDRFYRADPARESSGDESGLGLAIAKSIVNAHGGTITAASAVGQGTVMTIVLPEQGGN